MVQYQGASINELRKHVWSTRISVVHGVSLPLSSLPWHLRFNPPINRRNNRPSSLQSNHHGAPPMNQPINPRYTLAGNRVSNRRRILPNPRVFLRRRSRVRACSRIVRLVFTSSAIRTRISAGSDVPSEPVAPPAPAPRGRHRRWSRTSHLPRPRGRRRRTCS